MKYLNCILPAIVSLILWGCAVSPSKPRVSIEQSHEQGFPYLLRVSWDIESHFNPHTFSPTRSKDRVTTYIFIRNRTGINSDGDFVVNYVPSVRNPRIVHGKIILSLADVRIELAAAKAVGFGFSKDEFEPFVWNGAYLLEGH